jgi:transcriptional regulator with PAS, ATPase and Fis domain
VGAFERAHGGTLFLDEIGEMPVELQPRLLRALESRSVRRVGGKQERKIDVRIVAATNRDLRNDVANGKFREDLFFRLAVAVVPVPALRRRLDDLPYLVPSLLSALGRPDLGVTDSAFAVLQSHSWPGNVRELKNALACALAFVDPGAHTLDPSHLRLLKATEDDASRLDNLPLGGQCLEHIERAAIRQTMAQTDGNKTYAARTLGIAVSTLYEKLKKYGI